MFRSRHHTESVPELLTFGDFIYYAYANMQMLIVALDKGKSAFDKDCYRLRLNAYRAYCGGRWRIHDLRINNKWKSEVGDYCWCCLKRVGREELETAHLFPLAKGGADDADNSVMVCKECNSTLHDLDFLEWFSTVRKQWPSPHVFAYYLKLVYLYAVKYSLLCKTSAEIDAMNLPFRYEYIPLSFPNSYLARFAALRNPAFRSDNPQAYLPRKD